MSVLQIANTDVRSDVVDIYEGERGKLYGRVKKYIIGTSYKIRARLSLPTERQ